MPKELSVVIFHRVYFVTAIEYLFPNRTYKSRLLFGPLVPINVHAQNERRPTSACTLSEAAESVFRNPLEERYKNNKERKLLLVKF